MTLSDINNRITFYTGADTNNYTNAQRLIAINKAIDDIQIMILQSQDEWDYDDTNNTDFPILTTDLVNAQQDYSLPSGILKIKRVETTYDGSKWYKAEPLDINEIGDATDTTSIAQDFDKTKPYYDFQYGSVFLYPIPDTAVTGGLKLWISRQNTAITSSQLTTGTYSPGFDRQFHDMISLSASLDWAIKNDKKNLSNLKNQLIEYEQRLKRYYNSKQKDRKYSLKPAYIDYE